jgi:hypothetical protein
MLIAYPDWLRRTRACYSLVLGFTWFVCSLAPATADSAADPAVIPAAVVDPYSPRAAYAPFLNDNSMLDDAVATHADGYAWRGVPPVRPDWRGVRRDTAYFLGHQFAVIAVLYVAPESISGWSREQKESYSFDKWRNNVSQPVWDDDLWWINYILHPYWGGAYYIRARERGLDRVQSFWFSALLSTLFEYGAEALAEPVSAQDLVVTPVAGFLVGEYLFSPLRQRIRAKPGKLDWSDKAILVITDPLGVLNAETDRLLGVKTSLQWQAIGMLDAVPAMGIDRSMNGPSGHPRSMAPAWGLQLRVNW